MRKRSELKQEAPPTAATMAAMDRAIAETELEEQPRIEPALPRSVLDRFADFSPGEQLTITIGQELYSPVKYATFTVGPFAATVTIRPNESGADAAMRCYRVLLELNEAEFNIAWARHRTRLGRMPKKAD